ncbi:MAG: hypothetical protein N2C12_03845 [Planctomycetales bacterium]
MGDINALFTEISERLAASGPDEALQVLGEALLSDKRYHDLFDVRRMQCRCRLGLSVAPEVDLDDLQEPLRGQVEEGYLAACREVGQLLLADGHVRHAWMYLRTSGDDQMMREGLAGIESTEANIDEIIEATVYEGVDPASGFRLLLSHYGTCNAITTFESAMTGRRPDERREVAEILVKWLHDELLRNLLASFEGEVEEPAERSVALRQLVEGCDEIFGQYTVHVDASHLSSVVRFARLLESREGLELALDLTEYGLRLHENFQYAGEVPFEETYRSHHYLFGAQLGHNVDEAVDYFRQRAETAEVGTDGTLPAETYLLLLARLGRFQEAVEAHLKLLPAGVQTSGFGPTVLELSRQSGEFAELLAAYREHDDVVGFAVGKIEEYLKQ